MIHYWYCVFIRCVGGYSLYVILQLLGLFIIAWGLGRVFWGLGGGVQVGGGGGKVEFLTEFFFFAKNCSWSLKTQKKKIYFSGGGGILGCLGRPTPPPGGRAGSENDTLLPMTMTCDRLKFWSGLAWRSKVIIRKPWRRKNKKNK